ncbi:MAG: hypothetical protein WA988_16585 [Candidatus Nanopelagicales bacterium]
MSSLTLIDIVALIGAIALLAVFAVRSLYADGRRSLTRALGWLGLAALLVVPTLRDFLDRLIYDRAGIANLLDAAGPICGALAAADFLAVAIAILQLRRFGLLVPIIRWCGAGGMALCYAFSSVRTDPVPDILRAQGGAWYAVIFATVWAFVAATVIFASLRAAASRRPGDTVWLGLVGLIVAGFAGFGYAANIVMSIGVPLEDAPFGDFTYVFGAIAQISLAVVGAYGLVRNRRESSTTVSV